MIAKQIMPEQTQQLLNRAGKGLFSSCAEGCASVLYLFLMIHKETKFTARVNIIMQNPNPTTLLNVVTLSLGTVSVTVFNKLLTNFNCTWKNLER